MGYQTTGYSHPIEFLHTEKGPQIHARLHREQTDQYRRYKGLVDVVLNRHIVYNRALELIEDPPKGVELFTIYPSKKPFISRLEKDKELLEKQWKMGYDKCRRIESKLVEFL